MSVSPLNSPNSNVNQVLQNYRLFAMTDLRGPASATSLMLNAEMAKLAQGYNYNKALIESLQSGFKVPSQMPATVDSKPFLLMRADSQCVQTDAILEDQLIASFEIGGEKRLCLPQIFKTVLAGFTLHHINQACDKLFIYCSRCNNEQLDLFRKTRNLPPTATTCGLITMTDAERLCMDLLHSSNDSENNNYMSSSTTDAGRRPKPSETCIPVYHECFGAGTGLFKPELYSSANAKCIECLDCGRLFSTRRFVGHCHKNQENRICHWGFDRNKWRSYLLLADEMIADEVECAKLEQILNQQLDKFSSEPQQSPEAVSRKRKIENDEDEKVTRRRFSDSQLQVNRGLPTTWMMPSSPYSFPRPNGDVWPAITANGVDVNASTTPMKARLQMQTSCPPTLENPERVVTSCQTTRYEKHYVPNIALQQSNELEEDRESDHGDVSSSSSQLELDLQNNNVSKSCHPSDSIQRSFTPDGSELVKSVFDNLERMERLYMQLLQATRNLSPDEKDTLEVKYFSYSESIRRHMQLDGSSADEQSTEG